jgi:hypothetical protein
MQMLVGYGFPRFPTRLAGAATIQPGGGPTYLRRSLRSFGFQAELTDSFPKPPDPAGLYLRNDSARPCVSPRRDEACLKVSSSKPAGAVVHGGGSVTTGPKH